MSVLDRSVASLSRGLARHSSRRGLLARLGTAMVGAGALPLLPVARAAAASGGAGDASKAQDPGDPTSCEYWRYCASSAFLASCCGGSVNQCPPGTEMSALTWIGTCRNPADGRDYIISYNDCCGNSSCGQCFCHRDEGATPIVRPQTSNEANWCFGTNSTVVHSSVAIILGVADPK